MILNSDSRRVIWRLRTQAWFETPRPPTPSGVLEDPGTVVLDLCLFQGTALGVTQLLPRVARGRLRDQDLLLGADHKARTEVVYSQEKAGTQCPRWAE